MQDLTGELGVTVHTLYSRIRDRHSVCATGVDRSAAGPGRSISQNAGGVLSSNVLEHPELESSRVWYMTAGSACGLLGMMAQGVDSFRRPHQPSCCDALGERDEY
ncbi:hypothetical protein ACIBEK_07400 [Nocardia fusca]|uniref:hypothetical protein n=1 Tax=Nocardia fusca TaxID=941183 RepID=UPI0037B018CF